MEESCLEKQKTKISLETTWQLIWRSPKRALHMRLLPYDHKVKWHKIARQPLSGKIFVTEIERISEVCRDNLPLSWQRIQVLGKSWMLHNQGCQVSSVGGGACPQAWWPHGRRELTPIGCLQPPHHGTPSPCMCTPRILNICVQLLKKLKMHN